MPTPEAYKAELPKDLKLPQGVDFKFDDKDPLLGPVLAEARKTANELGLDQAGFSRLLGLHAAARASEISTLNAAHEAEVAKLGPAGQARVGAMQTFIGAKFGADALKAIMPSIVTAAQVEVWESVIKTMTSQGTSSFSAAHRDPPQGSRVSQAEYDKMGYSEKKDYAAKFGNGAAA